MASIYINFFVCLFVLMASLPTSLNNFLLCIAWYVVRSLLLLCLYKECKSFISARPTAVLVISYLLTLHIQIYCTVKYFRYKESFTCSHVVNVLMIKHYKLILFCSFCHMRNKIMLWLIIMTKLLLWLAKLRIMDYYGLSQYWLSYFWLSLGFYLMFLVMSMLTLYFLIDNVMKIIS